MREGCHVCGRSGVAVEREWGPFEVFKKVAVCDSCRHLGESFESLFIPLGGLWCILAVISFALTALDGWPLRAAGWLAGLGALGAFVAWVWVIIRFERVVREIKRRASKI